MPEYTPLLLSSLPPLDLLHKRHLHRGLPSREFAAGVTNFDNLRLGIDLILGINAFEGYRLQFDFAEGMYLFPT